MDRVSLNSHNHNLNLVNSLDHFKAVNSFVDVTLVCEGHTVKAHKIILSAGSNVLHRLLLANPAKHPIIILTETKYDTLRMIMDFLYKGRVDITRNDVNKLLAVAVTFEMNELKRLCEENLNSQKAADSVPNLHPCSKSLDLGDSSPKNKRQRRQSSDSDILCDAVFPKREISYSPCSFEQLEVSSLTDALSASAQTEVAGFHPQIENTRSLNKTSVESSYGNDLTVGYIQNTSKKDASTECDIHPLKEIRSNLMLRKPTRVIVRPKYTEKSDDSESDTQNKSKVISKRRRSRIWNYYTAVTDSHATCKICQRKLCYKTAVSNLSKHLINTHKLTDPRHPTNDADLEIFEEIDFNCIEEEIVQDEDHLQGEETSEEGVPSTSTPCILKIT